MRRRKHEEHVNHEAWAIPYADLMTLLLAFFVVMYAVSVVNEGKFRVMSESLILAFNGSSKVIVPSPSSSRSRELVPSEIVPPGRPGASIVPIAVPIPPHAVPMKGDGSQPGQRRLHREGDLARIEDQVRRALQPLIDRKLVIVRNKQNWLEIEIRTDILFPSGVAQLSMPADQVLRNLASILAAFPNPLRVEGFTDDVPISTPVYPSNWELSAARAASVARLFASNGILPERLGIIGWGEVRPAADNATAEGRNQNRRVLVVVMGNQSLPQRSVEEASHLGQAVATTETPTPPQTARVTPAVPTSGEVAPDRVPASDVASEPAVILAVPPEVVPAAEGHTGAVPQRIGPNR